MDVLLLARFLDTTTNYNKNKDKTKLVNNHSIQTVAGGTEPYSGMYSVKIILLSIE